LNHSTRGCFFTRRRRGRYRVGEAVEPRRCWTRLRHAHEVPLHRFVAASAGRHYWVCKAVEAERDRVGLSVVAPDRPRDRAVALGQRRPGSQKNTGQERKKCGFHDRSPFFRIGLCRAKLTALVRMPVLARRIGGTCKQEMSWM